ncbi:MAG: glycoside hydrolase family 99-like domain-containing protein [Desulfobulbaceae bacterium]|nr:glycoside hydrolase family 99-like domain-containing protein [Desulfobulbaceae bacterium]
MIEKNSNSKVEPAEQASISHFSHQNNTDYGLQEDAAFSVLSGLQVDPANAIKIHDESKLIAFYLPQYHRISENSEWWGPGFTEWTNVVKAKPNFSEHYQPHLPRELGFYDLSHPDVMREQAEMAKLYGIYGFCFYYYWFSGHRVLEKPIDNFIASDIDINYCLCWANENWTRTWDGDTKNILLHQKYESPDALTFITSLLPHFRDHRYIRVDGKPMLVVYRAKEIPNVENVFTLWRKAVKEAGFKGLHIAVVDFYDISTPMEVGADALVEFPPHKFNGPQNVPDQVPAFTNDNFHGGVLDYAKIIAQSAGRTVPEFILYRGIIPSWDNTARRQDNPTIVHKANPGLFGDWLRYLRAYNRENIAQKDDNFIFVNAWNEWGEGCHLEPDEKWGLAYLEAVTKSAYYLAEEETLHKMKQHLLYMTALSVTSGNGEQDPSIGQIDETVNRLINTQPVGGLAQKIAYKLRNRPFLYKCGKLIYVIYLKLRG